MRRLKVLASADASLLEAVTWFKAHGSAEYAERFMREAVAAFREIAERPMAWPVSKHDPELRVRHLLKLRYTVYYSATLDTVEIVELWHMRRQPRAWKNRR
jgi:plasmid stabilization system protein ParE